MCHSVTTYQSSSLTAEKLFLTGYPDREVGAALKDMERRLARCETRTRLLEGLAQEEAVRRVVRWWRTLRFVRRLEDFIQAAKIYREARRHWNDSILSVPPTQPTSPPV